MASASLQTNARDITRPITIKAASSALTQTPLIIGGGSPVVVQSMLNVATSDPKAALAQIQTLAKAGCELIRVAVPSRAALEGFTLICEQSPLPVVADIHFDHRLALAAIDAGACKLRINPGNIGTMDKVDAVIDAAKVNAVPIRIGVNAGSLAVDFAARQDLTWAQKLAASAKLYAEHFMMRGFDQIVISTKAHDVKTTVDAYKLLAKELPDIPLHIGITETGTIFQGTIKSSVGLGALLLDGIGDTLRVSLTADPVDEVKVAWELLSATGLRRQRPELISCPTCGRCEVDLITIANAVEERLSAICVPISVAVMGCSVNGPGEARDADVGVACSKGFGEIFVKGQIIKKVPEADIIDELFKQIYKLHL